MTKLIKIEILRFRFGAAALCLLMILLSACAAAPPGVPEDAPPESTNDVVNSGPEIQPEPVDEEVMYRVLAGEFLGSEGDLQSAVDEYLEAAMISSDPEIAQRATRIAFAAECWPGYWPMRRVSFPR